MRRILHGGVIALLLITTLAASVPGFGQTVPDRPDERGVSSTILRGGAQFPAAAPSGTPDAPPKSGDVSLNFPGVDVRQVAKAVLGDILGVQYSIDPGLTTPVTVVTQRPIARSAVLPFLEGALRASDLAIVPQNGVFVIAPVDQARDQAAQITDAATGFGTETHTLRFVGAEPMKALLEPVLPGVVVQADSSSNTLTIAGTTGQRRSVRDLIAQFDVNWLQAMSFALIVPQRTDARLITPELDKLLNGPGAPTAGLVKLIAMERLNGILAVSPQPQYLDDVRRWVEILDREGQNNEKRLFVYRVQNGRSADLSKTLINAFGGSGGAGGRNGLPGIGLGGDQRSGRVADGGNSNASTSSGSDNSVPSGNPLSPAGGSSSSFGSSDGSSNDTGGGNGDSNSGDSSSTVNLGDGLSATISSDNANNAIVVYATPRVYAVIEEGLRKLDVPPQQVMIEAAITEVTLTNELAYGVQWLFRDGNFNIGQVRGSTQTPTRVFPGFSALYANSGSIVATLNALENLTKINVVSAPKLLVLNNQTASLQVGDQVPILSGTAVSVENPDAPIVNSVEYRDTGVILKVTPRVNSGGLVLLDVSQEVSTVVNARTDATVASPTISTRKVASAVAVQDGEVLALGGLISDSTTKGNSGIPFLSRIPILGALFGNRTNDLRRTELLILLRPRVIRNSDDGKAITNELREKMQMLRGGIERLKPVSDGISIP